MRGHEIRLEQVCVRFGAVTAVEPTDLTIEAGEFFSILGPSGCGKTTLLRVVSGFLSPSEGRVLIGGRDLTATGPAERPTAMIFQSLALFPQMTVWENVAFGLEARGVDKATRKRRAEELLALVALAEHAGKRPSELSGGQRQRVAIARALAVEPAVLLLDEPLSALDLKLRQHMRAELKAIQRRTGVTFIYITHDQGEALAMSDRIAVMSKGRIEQVATPDGLYATPATPFVATFVGEQNVAEGTIAAIDSGIATLDTPLGRLSGRLIGKAAAGARARLMVRPERLHHAAHVAPTPNTLSAAFARRDLEGPVEMLVFDLDGAQWSIHRQNHGETPRTGPVELAFATEDAMVFAEATP
ncbi:MAG: ABC transporter ATP-binding protein [Hyphomicrobiaceae bacterium]|nr:ABC transporter ATP-binding protein [Hyphomicrobiaceae bacterium]